MWGCFGGKGYIWLLPALALGSPIRPAEPALGK